MLVLFLYFDGVGGVVGNRTHRQHALLPFSRLSSATQRVQSHSLSLSLSPLVYIIYKNWLKINYWADIDVCAFVGVSLYVLCKWFMWGGQWNNRVLLPRISAAIVNQSIAQHNIWVLLHIERKAAGGIVVLTGVRACVCGVAGGFMQIYHYHRYAGQNFEYTINIDRVCVEFTLSCGRVFVCVLAGIK